MMADLDLQNAFHQILLDEFSSNLSAFTDPFTGKRYQRTNMWFGESGSTTQMQKVVQAALTNNKGFFVRVFLGEVRGGVEG